MRAILIPVGGACRLVQGWRHGLELDENLRTHPLLVPFEVGGLAHVSPRFAHSAMSQQLSVKDQEANARTVRETLSCILQLGFFIELDREVLIAAPW